MATANPLSGIVKLSTPSKDQVIHGVERVLLVFVTVSVGYWLKTPNPFSKDAGVGAALAGGAAIWEGFKSITTTL